MNARLGLVMVAAVLLAGCGSTRRSVAIEPGRPTAVRPSHPPPPGSTYRVVRGDTLYSIAFRNGLDFRQLADWNGIDAPYLIHPGQRLHLSRPVRVRRRRPATPPAPPARAPAAIVTTAPAPSHAPAPHGPTRSTAGVVWRWPADGRLISGFRRDDAIPGIELAGRAGQPVRAAADGVVVYSGNGLVGYGELVIIKHSDSLLSAYGHNRKRLVKEGQRVDAGQVIAEMGSTGATRDELEFQIRRDGNPVDPLDFLPAR